MSSVMLVSSPKAAMATLKPLNFRLLLNRCMSQVSKEIADSYPCFRLLGPPEIYQSPSPLKQESVNNVDQIQSPASVADPFMDSMVSNFNTARTSAPQDLLMGFTENYSPTYLSSGILAWISFSMWFLTHHQLKDGFYASALWLFENHPKTLVSNADSVAKFGYFKDLPEMLHRLQHGLHVRKISQKKRKRYLMKSKLTDVPKTSRKEKLLAAARKRRIFPRDSYPEYEGIEDAHYAYRVRDRLPKQVLVPLRKALQLPEVYIGANQWNILPYNRVASIAMKNYELLFLKHDKERFEGYLNSVKKGKAKIAAGACFHNRL
ncbi:hypothetical protein CRYUN_Cryun04dG0160000 [Craigia yunnanensis]